TKFSANTLRMKLWLTYSPLAARDGLHRSPPACSYSKKAVRRYQIVSTPFRQELPHAGRSTLPRFCGCRPQNLAKRFLPRRLANTRTTVPILLRVWALPPLLQIAPHALVDSATIPR